MATPAVTNTFVAATPALASQVNANFTDLIDFLTDEVVHLDGAKTMTGDLTLRSADPSSANHATRKSYVDTHDWDNAGEDSFTSTWTQASATSGTWYTTDLSTSVTFTQNETYRIDFYLPAAYAATTAPAYSYRVLARLQIAGVTKRVVQQRQYFASSGNTMQTSLRYKHTGSTGASTVRVQISHEVGSASTLTIEADSDTPALLTVCHLGKE